jgi:aryl-alcohol dehydrogenase-like predicted oxidoreductase
MTFTKKRLGSSDLLVPPLCLGTMTYGGQWPPYASRITIEHRIYLQPYIDQSLAHSEQNTEQEAFEQLDYALSRGVNFIDTAEL